MIIKNFYLRITFIIHKLVVFIASNQKIGIFIELLTTFVQH